MVSREIKFCFGIKYLKEIFSNYVHVEYISFLYWIDPKYTWFKCKYMSFVRFYLFVFCCCFFGVTDLIFLSTSIQLFPSIQHKAQFLFLSHCSLNHRHS